MFPLNAGLFFSFWCSLHSVTFPLFLKQRTQQNNQIWLSQFLSRCFSANSATQVDKLDTQRIVTVRCCPANYNQDSINLNHFHMVTEFMAVMQSPYPSVHQATYRSKPFCHAKNNCVYSVIHAPLQGVFLLLSPCRTKLQGPFRPWSFLWLSVNKQGLPHSLIRTVHVWRLHSPQFISNKW